MNRTSLVICLAAAWWQPWAAPARIMSSQQTTPLINKTNELDDLTAKNTKDIKDVDARAQAGIQRRERQDCRSRAEGPDSRTEGRPGHRHGRRRQRTALVL